MLLYLFENLISQKPTFVFLNIGNPRGRRVPTNPLTGEEEEEEISKEEAEKREREKRYLEDERTRTERAEVSNDTKQLMRECIASDNIERHNLVDRLLEKTISEQDFRKTLETVDREDASWKMIFDRQREVRKKIQDLQWKAESYVELIPRGKDKFETMVRRLRGLNSQDDTVDRNLKRELQELTQDRTNRKAVLNPDEAREIYSANPVSEGVDRTLKKYKERIEATPAGQVIYRKLLALKKEEMRIERQFNQFSLVVDNIVIDHLRKIRSKAQREHLLKTASKSVGVRIKVGTIIKFEDPDILGNLAPGQDTVTITKVEFEPILVRDPKTGKVISQENGVPFITLGNGAKMPLGRFKKWIDAAGGAEQVNSLGEAEEILDLKSYGIKIEKNMELYYPKRTVNERGEVTVTPCFVLITNIENDRIYFNEPVLFRVGHAGIDVDEARESLSLSEFVKWWQRYMVEKSMGYKELCSLLEIYNKNENKLFGYEPKDNPVILVKEGEALHYADEEGRVIRIRNINPTDGITLDNDEKFLFPEFFYWIKNNHVQKVKDRPKTAEESTAEEKRTEDIINNIAENKNEDAEMREIGEQNLSNIREFIKVHDAGTTITRLKEAWWKTRFLSMKDLFNMGKEVMEFVKRKHERRSKDRYGQVGSRLPWVIDPEFERVKQSAENEEVNKYKEAMEQWGVEKVKETLYGTNSKDLAKACILTLLHHGEMRWDDPRFWKTCNRLTARYTLRGSALYIPEPHMIPPGYNGEDMTQPAMNALWGDGQSSQWFQENISKYNGNKKNFEFKFKNLEADPKGTGGPDGECERLLKEWRAGRYVNPQDYEEMIDGAIIYGKMGAEKKMFFIIAGLIARHGGHADGETLLSMDRPGELNSLHLNRFPLLDFFTQEKIMDYTIFDPEANDGKGAWGKARKLQLKDYEKWKEDYFPDDFNSCKPGAQFSRFMWEVMMMSEKVRTRISKGIRSAENMDHDDAQLYIPPTTPGEIDSLTTGPSGQKKYFTNSGYANGYPGFNQYILALSYAIEEEDGEEGRRDKEIALRDSISAFVRFDAILDNRLFKSEGDKRARLDDRHYQRPAVVDSSCNMGLHQTQLRNLVLEVGKAYGQDWHTWLYGAKTGSIFDPEEEKKQKLYEQKIDSLKELIPRLIDQDGGAKVMEVIKRFRARADVDKKDPYALRGIDDSKRPNAEQIKILKTKARAARKRRLLEGHNQGVHGGGGH